MMNTAKVKTMSIIRPKPSITTRKTAHLNPIKRKMSKTAAEEYLPMVLQPPPEAESMQQYAIPMAGSGRMGNSEDSVKEMLQICNKLDEYTKDLENVYGKKNGDVDTKTSHVERQFFSFLSTCDSAARELDTTINVEHKILESLYQGYEKEAQLLEQLGEEDITADSDLPTSHDTVTALVSKLMEILHKLQGIKDSFLNLPRTHPQEPPLASTPINTEKKGREAQIYGPKLKSAWKDRSQNTDSVVRALQELMADTDIRSREVLERILHDVGQLFDTQAMELQKLGKDHEETENKYIKVKANYQTLLQEKRILETELKKLLAWKASQKSSPMMTPSLEERLEKDIEPIQSAEPMTASVIKHESEVYIEEEKLEKVRTLSKSQDKELQEDATPPADSSTFHKKAKMQEKMDTDVPDISYTYDLDQGDMCMSSTAEPSDPDVREPKKNGGPESKSVVFSLDLKEVPEGNENKVKTKKQKLKSLKSRGRKLSTVLSKGKLAKETGKKSDKMTFASSEKLEDKSLTESKNQQDPEMQNYVSNQKKNATKLSRTSSSSGKGKAKLNEEDAIMTNKPSVQSPRAEKSMAHEQQVTPGGPESSKSAGKQQGRRQSLSSKSRLLSLVKEEKLANEEEVHKGPTGMLEVMNVIPENQDGKRIAHKKVHADREPTVVNVKGNRDHFTGHRLSKTSGPDQKHGLWKEMQQSQEKYKNLAEKVTQADSTSEHQEYLEIPDKADEETAQSGNRLEPTMMTGLHFQVHTDKYQLLPLEHKRQQKQFGEEIHTQIGQSPLRLEAANLVKGMNPDDFGEYDV